VLATLESVAVGNRLHSEVVDVQALALGEFVVEPFDEAPIEQERPFAVAELRLQVRRVLAHWWPAGVTGDGDVAIVGYRDDIVGDS